MTPRIFTVGVRSIIILALLCVSLIPTTHLTYAQVRTNQLTSLEGGVQGFLERRNSGLADLSIEGQSAARIIENIAWYYNVEVRIILALLETASGLIDNPNVTLQDLEYPFGAGPQGFVGQIDWVTREVRAAFGPYDLDPTVKFSDGSTLQLSKSEDQHSLAIRRFLAQGHSKTQWSELVKRYPVVYETLFRDEPIAARITAPLSSGFLSEPWVPGTRIIHSSYFDHAYPMVDDGGDGNDIMVNYLGHTGLSYNGHDGHDYYFPDQPYGTPILAAASGWGYARTTRGLGVVIQHTGVAAGYETVYWHLEGFAKEFRESIDAGPIWVERGDLLGWSGATGFTDGAPHLHFEVRHNGLQVDPYGWYGPGDDPCANFSRCERSTWLWDSSVSWSKPDVLVQPDTTPPTALLTINPASDVLLHVGFEADVLPSVGPLPASNEVLFNQGRWGQAGRVGPDARLSFPTSSTLDLDHGTVALWVDVPESWIDSYTGRHYLLAASAFPADESSIYSSTFALRHELKADSDQPIWTFWTVDDQGVDQKLSVPDTLKPGWHHFAIVWDAKLGSKALFIDGALAARADNVSLPTRTGELLEIGRWTFGAGESRIWLDELVSYNRALLPAEVNDLAQAEQPLAISTSITSNPNLELLIPADDDSGGVVQLQLGINGVYTSPMPYYRSFSWDLPRVEDTYTISVRLTDRLGNTTTLTQSVTINKPPSATVELQSWTTLTATLAISATDQDVPLEMSLNGSPNPTIKVWEAMQLERIWSWLPMQPRRIYVWFRDAQGMEVGPYMIGPDVWRMYLPHVKR